MSPFAVGRSRRQQKGLAREPGRPWSYAEAAEFLGVCTATVARACRDARIKSVAFGRRRLIPDAELHRVASQGF